MAKDRHRSSRTSLESQIFIGLPTVSLRNCAECMPVLQVSTTCAVSKLLSVLECRENVNFCLALLGTSSSSQEMPVSVDRTRHLHTEQRNRWPEEFNYP
jgi:hypothetical protein